MRRKAPLPAAAHNQAHPRFRVDLEADLEVGADLAVDSGANHRSLGLLPPQGHLGVWGLT